MSLRDRDLNDDARGDELSDTRSTTYRRSRPLSGVERLLWVIDHAARANMMFDLEVSGAPPSTERVERAYEVMRSQQPILRTRLRGWSRPVLVDEAELAREELTREELTREELTREELMRGDQREIRVTLPISIRDHEPTSADLDEAMSARLDLHLGPPVHLHIFRSPSLERWRALFVVHHMATDAASCLRSIQAFLDALSPAHSPLPRVEWSAEHTLPSRALIPRSAKSLRAIARSISRRVSEHVGWLLRGYPEQLAEMRTSSDPSSLLSSEPSSLPSVGSAHYPLPASQVRQLRDLARQGSSSLHALMCAAQLLAIRETLSGTTKRTLSVYSPTNLRPRLSYMAKLTASLDRERRLEERPVTADHMGQFVGYAQSSVKLDQSPERESLYAVAAEISRQLRSSLSTSDDATVHHISDQLADWIDRESWWRRVTRWARGDQRDRLDQLGDEAQRAALLARAQRLAQTLKRSVFHSTVLSSVGEAGLSLDSSVGSIEAFGTFGCPGAMNAWMSVATLQEGALYWAFSWSRESISDRVATRLSERSVYHLTRLIGVHDE